MQPELTLAFAKDFGNGIFGLFAKIAGDEIYSFLASDPHCLACEVAANILSDCVSFTRTVS